MLIVSVERVVVPLVICRFFPFGVKEQTGAIATRGAIDPHASVIPFDGVLYPLAAFMLTTPSAPLPGGTLLGETEL